MDQDPGVLHAGEGLEHPSPSAPGILAAVSYGDASIAVVIGSFFFLLSWKEGYLC